MNRISFTTIILYIFSFQYVFTNEIDLKDISILKFDVVEKEIFFDKSIPIDLHKNINNWFDNRIKINGFSGKLSMSVFDFTENISLIDKGKKVESYLKFKLIISNDNYDNKTIEGKVNSFSSINGRFSIKDFEDLVESNRINLVKKLSVSLTN